MKFPSRQGNRKLSIMARRREPVFSIDTVGHVRIAHTAPQAIDRRWRYNWTIGVHFVVAVSKASQTNHTTAFTSNSNDVSDHNFLRSAEQLIGKGTACSSSSGSSSYACTEFRWINRWSVTQEPRAHSALISYANSVGFILASVCQWMFFYERWGELSSRVLHASMG